MALVLYACGTRLFTFDPLHEEPRLARAFGENWVATGHAFPGAVRRLTRPQPTAAPRVHAVEDSGGAG